MPSLLLLAAIIYAGKAANYRNTAKPHGDTRRDLMRDAIEEARALVEMVGEG